MIYFFSKTWFLHIRSSPLFDRYVYWHRRQTCINNIFFGNVELGLRKCYVFRWGPPSLSSLVLVKFFWRQYVFYRLDWDLPTHPKTVLTNFHKIKWIMDVHAPSYFRFFGPRTSLLSFIRSNSPWTMHIFPYHFLDRPFLFIPVQCFLETFSLTPWPWK